MEEEPTYLPYRRCVHCLEDFKPKNIFDIYCSSDCEEKEYYAEYGHTKESI
jgi:hypothetical protein